MKKISVFIVLIFLSSFLINKFLDHYYKKYWGTTFNKLETVFNDTTKRDIVFLGDSRTHFGVNPFYIDSITNKNSFNVGMGGAPISEITFLTKAWLNNHKAPEVFVVSIGLTGLIDSEKYFSIPCYYFYYLNDTLTYNTLSILKYHTFLNKYIPLTKFTAFDEFQKTCIIRSLKGDRLLKNDGITYKGFINNETGNNFNEAGNFKFEDLKIKNEQCIDTAILKLRELILIVKSYNSNIIFVYPPSYKLKKDKEAEFFFQRLRNKVEKLVNNEGLKLLHFDNDSSFTKSLFQDPSHLNIQGSILYSKKLGIELKEILK
jgi:hypothetical protein